MDREDAWIDLAVVGMIGILHRDENQGLCEAIDRTLYVE